GGHAGGELRHELRPLHPCAREVRCVLLKLLLPVALTYDDAAPDLLRVAKELAIARQRARAREAVGERGPVEAEDLVARVLELDGEEEGRRDVDALHFAARRVRAATRYLVRPEL